MPIQFPAVKMILDNIITNWTTGNGSPPDLVGNHGPTFKWDTREDLLAASAKGKQLIQPQIVGQPGLGKTANLVVDLIAGVAPFPRMPLGGVDSNNGIFLDVNSPEIQTIIGWIEGGCLP
jgi:hypothetical protein